MRKELDNQIAIDYKLFLPRLGEKMGIISNLWKKFIKREELKEESMEEEKNVDIEKRTLTLEHGVRRIETHLCYIEKVGLFVFLPLLILCVYLIALIYTNLPNLKELNPKISALNTKVNEFDKKINLFALEERTFIPNPGISSRVLLFNSTIPDMKDLYLKTGLEIFKNAANSNWSSNSKKIVFISVKGKETEGDIYLYDFNKKVLKHLPTPGYNNLDPKFSPNGKTIVFSARKKGEGRWNIMKISIDGKEFVPLTDPGKKFGNFDKCDYPSWSPDGKYIIFSAVDSSTENDGYYIFIMDSDGNNRKFICDTGNVCNASFSPDGKWIVFRENKGNPFNDIWITPIKDGNCLIDRKSDLKKIEKKISGFIKKNGCYMKRLTFIGKNPEEQASGHLDPAWINDEEIMYVTTNEFKLGDYKAEKGKKLEEEIQKSRYNKNWSVKIINIYTGKIEDLNLPKGVYRNPQVTNLLFFNYF